MTKGADSASPTPSPVSIAQFEGIDAVRAFVDGMEIGFSTDYHFTLGQAIVTPEVYSYEWTMSGNQ